MKPSLSSVTKSEPNSFALRSFLLFELSKWAKLNAKKAAWLIVLCHIVIGTMGAVSGLLLWSLDAALPPWLPYPCFALMAAAFSIYPRARTAHNWVRRKAIESMAVFPLLMVWMWLGLQYATVAEKDGVSLQLLYRSSLLQSKPAMQHKNSSPDQATRPYISRGNCSETNVEYETVSLQTAVPSNEEILVHGAMQIQSKESKAQETNLHVKQDKTSAFSLPVWARILLFILALAVGIAASIFILGLSCALACDGYAVLAVVVLLAGETLIIIGLVLVTRSLFRKKNLTRHSKNSSPG